MTGLRNRAEALREYEAVCYHICLTLLGEKDGACLAAENTLLELARDDRFWRKPADQRERYVLRAAFGQVIGMRADVSVKA